MKLDLIRELIAYHNVLNGRVWESIGEITDQQFLEDDAYSRGSIRNLMVHLASTDRRWLAGLKNLPDVGHLKFEDFSSRSVAHQVFENTAKELEEYVRAQSEEELDGNAADMSDPRWVVLVHLVNHGTDHRATVLQRLHELGAPTFDQDFIIWHWSEK